MISYSDTCDYLEYKSRPHPQISSSLSKKIYILYRTTVVVLYRKFTGATKDNLYINKI